MAEDGFLAFKFTDREDNFDADKAVLAISDTMFFDKRADMFGNDATQKMNIGVGETPDGIAEIDFVEAFEFSF